MTLCFDLYGCCMPSVWSLGFKAKPIVQVHFVIGLWGHEWVTKVLSALL